MTKATLVGPNETKVLTIRDELKELSNSELRDQLVGQLQLTADHLLRLALIIRELEERGDDLADLRLGLLPYLRKVAHGQVAPEIVVRYAGFPAMIQRIANYPLPDQRRIASGDPVPLVVLRDGATDIRQVDPLHLSREQLHQVFAVDHVRSVAEQAAIVEQRKLDPPAKKTDVKRSRVKADVKRMGLRIGRSFGSLEDILLALIALADEDYDDSIEGESQLMIKLTVIEHQQLKVRAAKSKCSMNKLVRRALAASGLFKDAET